MTSLISKLPFSYSLSWSSSARGEAACILASVCILGRTSVLAAFPWWDWTGLERACTPAL